MKIRDLKAVIVDDAAVKSIHIKRALQFCGVENIVMFDHQEALWEYLETSEADLIVTDMHYPLAKGERENEKVYGAAVMRGDAVVGCHSTGEIWLYNYKIVFER